MLVLYGAYIPCYVWFSADAANHHVGHIPQPRTFYSLWYYTQPLWWCLDGNQHSSWTRSLWETRFVLAQMRPLKKKLWYQTIVFSRHQVYSEWNTASCEIDVSATLWQSSSEWEKMIQQTTNFDWSRLVGRLDKTRSKSKYAKHFLPVKYFNNVSLFS